MALLISSAVMKTTDRLLIAFIWLISPAMLAQPGLKGEYFNGTGFEKKIATRIDPKISFNWQGRSPVPGIGLSYFSVRWTGKLYAPASGKYDFSATVDDGIRVWVGNQTVIDAWALHDDANVRGSIVLEAGKYYDLRVDYFNDLLEGKINLLWHRPDDANQQLVTLNQYGRPVVRPDGYRPIEAEYLYRTAPLPPKPVTAPPKPVVAVSKPKPVKKSEPTVVTTNRPPPSVAIVSAPSVAIPLPEKKPVAERLETLETGKVLVLENVFFEQSTYKLLPESFAELDRLINALKQNSAIRIEIAGHTDNIGDPRLNQTLSEYRAKTILNYITQHGIDGSRLRAEGYGSSRPLAGNATESARARNRRVELIVK